MPSSPGIVGELSFSVLESAANSDLVLGSLCKCQRYRAQGSPPALCRWEHCDVAATRHGDSTLIFAFSATCVTRLRRVTQVAENASKVLSVLS